MRKSVIIWAVWLLMATALFVFTGATAALLVSVFSLAAPIAAMLLAEAAARRLTARIELPAAANKGNGVRGELIVQNDAFIPLGRVSFAISVRNSLTDEARVLNVEFPLMPKARVSLPFDFVSEHCGQILFSCERAEVFDCFGFRAAGRKVDIFEKRLVLPDIFPIDAYVTSGAAPISDSETRYSDKKGYDCSEIFGLRDYAEGDSQKQIHRKLTHKYGKLIVIEPSEPVENSLLVLWDSSKAGAAVSDAIAESFISLCLALTDDGVIYNVAWTDRASGRLAAKEIVYINDIFDAAPGVLSASDAGASALRDADWTLTFPKVVRFASGAEADTGEMDAQGRLTVFTPRDYREALGSVVI